MYISTDCYYDIYLKNKDEGAVMSEITKLRAEIARLKYKRESPTYLTESGGYYMEDTEIEKYLEYLESAYKRYEELTGAVALTDEELEARRFAEAIDGVTQINLTIGAYYQYKYRLVFDKDLAYRATHHLGESEQRYELSASEAREELRALNIGAWDEHYSLEKYGFSQSEPTRWKLRIDFSSGDVSRVYEGSGVFPYNFDRLLRLLGAFGG